MFYAPALTLGGGENILFFLKAPATDDWAIGSGKGVTNGNFVIWHDTGNAAAMVIDTNRNVGIGTANPGAKLEVAGNILMSAAGATITMNAGGPTISVPTGNVLAFGTSGLERVRIDNLGNVGIGTPNPGAYKLAVKGKIHAEEVVVDTGWADFVFKKGYDLMPLEKVAKHIEESGHLPGIPTEREVKENGVSIGQIQSKLLQKIEEMTLYVIDLKKENDQLKERISLLENKSR